KLGASAQLLAPGEQNLLSAMHEDELNGPLTTLWPGLANVHRTVSPTLIATGLGEKTSWPFGATVISTVCAGCRDATSPRLCEGPEAAGVPVRPLAQFSSHTEGEPRSDRPSSKDSKDGLTACGAFGIPRHRPSFGCRACSV